MMETQRRGAFLVDVVVACAILSVGLLALAGFFLTAVRSGRELDHCEQASYLAEDRLEQLRHDCGEQWAAEDFLAEAGVETIWRGGVEYSRVTALKNRPDLDADGHLLEAEVRVSWRERLTPRTVALVTYFAVDTGLDELR